jgi:hypothetical protein
VQPSRQITLRSATAMPARRGLVFDQCDSPARATPDKSSVAPAASCRSPAPPPVPRERLPGGDDEITPPLAPPPVAVITAWAELNPVRAPLAFEEPSPPAFEARAGPSAQAVEDELPPLTSPAAAAEAADREGQQRDDGGERRGDDGADEAAAHPHRDRPREPPIPPALLALPRPVLAAALSHKQREARTAASASTSGVGSGGVGSGGATAAGSERQARTARRAWLEQHKLLHQRVALLSREIFAPSSLAEHDLAELLAPVLAEAAELARTRADEAGALSTRRARARQLTRRLGELVAHMGAGGGWMSELQTALEGADSEIASAKSAVRARAATPRAHAPTLRARTRARTPHARRPPVALTAAARVWLLATTARRVARPPRAKQRRALRRP